MSFLEPIVLGIIQGITEWLPVSSEGISSLVLLQFFEKTLQEAVYYSLWLHLGTLLAAVIYFKNDIKMILKGLPQYIRHPMKREQRLTHFLVIATLFTGAIGVPLVLYGITYFPASGQGAIAIIGGLLLVTGLLQLFAKKRVQFHKQPTLFMAVLVGIVQGFAALPGLSRSGLTMSVLLFAKYDAKQALRLSFLMSIPVVLGAQIGLQLLDALVFDLGAVVAIVLAFIVGLGTLKIFMHIAEKINFGTFCIGLGIISLAQLLV